MPRDLMEEGTYFGRLVEIGTDRLNNEARTPFVFVAWEVTYRAANGEWVPITPVTRESRWFTSEKAEPYTMDRLAQLGFNGDFDKPAFTADPNPQTEGLQLRCKHQYRNEQAYENWDLMGGGQKDREPWEAEQKRLFRAKYKTRMAGEKAPPGKPGAPPAAPAASKPMAPAKRVPAKAPIQEDEIPQDQAAIEDVPESDIPF